MAHMNNQAIYVIKNAKKNVDSFEFRWGPMKALVKPNIHNHLARECLSKHLQNSITYILRVKNDRVEQPADDDIVGGPMTSSLQNWGFHVWMFYFYCTKNTVAQERKFSIFQKLENARTTKIRDKF